MARIGKAAVNSSINASLSLSAPVFQKNSIPGREISQTLGTSVALTLSCFNEEGASVPSGEIILGNHNHP
jgi:hypothetical protein